jgi:hypothetical protein
MVTSATLDVEAHFSQTDFDRIVQGFVPASQDHRWFIWTDANKVVHLHRSWSGYEIYEVHLVADHDGYKIGRVRVNADPSQHASDAAGDEATLRDVLRSYFGA